MARLEQLRAEWRAREGNDLLQEETAKVARQAWTRRSVIAWTATVDGVVTTFGSTWIKASAGGAQFMLRPSDGAADQALRPFFATLMPGDVVSFDGIMAGETSLSMSGAFAQPHLTVDLRRIVRN